MYLPYSHLQFTQNSNLYHRTIYQLSKNPKILNRIIFLLEKKSPTDIPNCHDIKLSSTCRGILKKKRRVRKRYTRSYLRTTFPEKRNEQRYNNGPRRIQSNYRYRASTHSDIKTVLSLSLFRRRGCHLFLYRIHVSANFTSRYSSKPCHDNTSLFFLG